MLEVAWILQAKTHSDIVKLCSFHGALMFKVYIYKVKNIMQDFKSFCQKLLNINKKYLKYLMSILMLIMIFDVVQLSYSPLYAFLHGVGRYITRQLSLK